MNFNLAYDFVIVFLSLLMNNIFARFESVTKLKDGVNSPAVGPNVV